MAQRYTRRWQAAACALFLTAVLPLGVGTAVADAPSATADSTPPALLTTDFWVPLVPDPPATGTTVVAGDPATPAGVTSEGTPVGDPVDIAPLAVTRLRVTTVATRPVTASSAVLLVGEHSAQAGWDRWAAKGYAVAHVQLPMDAAGCADNAGAVDRAAMQAAAAYLMGKSRGFADAAAKTPALAQFSNGVVIAVGDGTGASPYLLGDAGISGIVAAEAATPPRSRVERAAAAAAAARLNAQQEAARKAEAAGTEVPAPQPLTVFEQCRITALAKPATDPYWTSRNVLPLPEHYAAPTLTVLGLGSNAVDGGAGLAVDTALSKTAVAHQLLLVQGAAAAAPEAAIDDWLSAVLAGTSAGVAPVVVQHKASLENTHGPAPTGIRLDEQNVWPATDSTLARLAATEIGVPTGKAITLSGQITAQTDVPATVRLEAVDPAGVMTVLATGAVTAGPTAIGLVDQELPAGTVLTLTAAPSGVTPVSEIGIDLPVVGGSAALRAAFEPPVTVSPTAVPPTTGTTSAAPSTDSSVPPSATTPPATPTSTPPSSTPPTSTPPTSTAPSSTPPSSSTSPTTTAFETSGSTGTSTAPTDPVATDGPDGTAPDSGEPSIAEPGTVGPTDDPDSSSAEPERPALPNLLGAPDAATDVPGPTKPAPTATGIGGPKALTMILDNSDPVALQTVTLAGVDGVATGDLRPIRVMGPATQGWNLTGQVSDFRSGNGVILADNLGWTPRVLGTGDGVKAGPAAAPGNGTGLQQFRVLCSGATSAAVDASCSGQLQLGVPATARSGEYTGLLTLTLI